eukprot:1139904-Pelagomonas_calceolata.AAC.2
MMNFMSFHEKCRTSSKLASTKHNFAQKAFGKIGSVIVLKCSNGEKEGIVVKGGKFSTYPISFNLPSGV